MNRKSNIKIYEIRNRILECTTKITQKNAFNIILIVLILIIVNIPYMQFGTYSNSDEFTSLAVPAYLSGKDWGETASLSGFHGFGFTIFLTPFFKFINDAKKAYQCVIVLALIVKIVYALLFNYILSHVCHIENFISSLATIAYVCGPLGPDDSCSLSSMSELPFALCVLLSMYFIIIAETKTGKKRFGYSFLSGLAIGYSYTIHSRCIIFLIMMLATYLVYFLAYKKVYGNIIGLLLGIGVSVGVLILATNYIKQNIYYAIQSEELANDTATVIKSSSYLIEKIFDIEKLKVALGTFGSLMSSVTLVSCGFFAFIFVSCIYCIIIGVKRRIEGSIFILAVFSLLSVCAMNFCISLTSTGSVAGGDYRWLTYIRYCKPFLGTGFLVAIYSIYNSNLFAEKKLRNYFWLCIVGSVIYINCSLAIKLSGKYGLNYSIINRIFYNPNTITVTGYFAAFSLVIISFSLFLIWCLRKKWSVQFLIVCIIIFSVINMEQTDFYVKSNAESVKKTDQSALIIKNVELPDGVIFVGDATRVTYSMLLQYAVFNKTLHYSSDLENSWNNVVLCTDISEYEGSNYRIQVDEGEYMYTSNEEAYLLLNQYLDNLKN